MNRILEFSPSQEEAVVSRILVLVHQAMDQHLPTAGQATRQFTKTVFSEDSSESTASLKAAGEVEREAAGAAAVASDVPAPHGSVSNNKDSETAASLAASVPTPPPAKASTLPLPPGSHAPSRDRKTAASPRRDTQAPAAVTSTEAPTGLDTSMRGIKATQSPDWVTRITLALLLAGLVLLAYALFA